MFKRRAFTMIELIFVIVIMGIIGKFGVEFLAQSYKSFIFSKVNHELQSTSGIALELIAAKLQNRIKDSVVARVGTTGAAVSIGSADGANFTVLEWVGADFDGFRGNSSGATPHNPNWSGIMDVSNAAAIASNTILVSPDTNTTAVDTLVKILSDNGATVDDVALFFIGSNSVATTDYGWDGVPITDQTNAMHPIQDNANSNQFVANTAGNFVGVDVFEYYQLAWTAYAISYEPHANNMGTLRFYWNYQPWQGDTIADANATIIMENVSTFQFISVGDILRIQVCTKSTIIDGENDGDGYSLCKEKTVL